MRTSRLMSAAARPSSWLVVVALLVVAAPSALRAQDALPPEARQFDFWVGEWDVNLRMLQDDLTWRDSVQAEAHIYPVLGGKAVLELWDSPSIKGFSLRHYDPAKQAWVLWLNWPSQNRSGSGSLEGTFRHGRGNFYSSSDQPDGSRSISRYSFNDITADSLRWDDAYSKDGGRTWTNNWIMEFSRTAARPELPPAGGELHTFDDGARCDLEQFRRYEFLSGRWEGHVQPGGQDATVPATLTGYRVLGGCVVLAFLRYEVDGVPHEVFHQLTWNTTAGRYELLLLDDAPSTPVRRMFSAADSDELRFESHRDDPGDRFKLHIDDSGQGFEYRMQRLESDGDAWVDELRASLREP